MRSRPISERRRLKRTTLKKRASLIVKRGRSVGLAVASDLSPSFQCQVGSSLVLRRPIETTALIGN